MNERRVDPVREAEPDDGSPEYFDVESTPFLRPAGALFAVERPASVRTTRAFSTRRSAAGGLAFVGFVALLAVAAAPGHARYLGGRAR